MHRTLWKSPKGCFRTGSCEEGKGGRKPDQSRPEKEKKKRPSRRGGCFQIERGKNSREKGPNLAKGAL